MPEASGDPPEIRCCCAVHSIRRERHPAAAQEQSTGLFHLNVRISCRIKKPRCQKASGFFGDPLEIRTPDPLLKRQLLYRLS